MQLYKDIQTYWQGNNQLCEVIPFDSFYTGMVSEGATYPYAVLVPLPSIPVYSVGSSYFEEYRFQISIFTGTDYEAFDIAEAVKEQFDTVAISANAMECFRENEMFIVEPGGIYHTMIEYSCRYNKTLA